MTNLQLPIGGWLGGAGGQGVMSFILDRSEELSSPGGAQAEAAVYTDDILVSRR